MVIMNEGRGEYGCTDACNIDGPNSELISIHGVQLNFALTSPDVCTASVGAPLFFALFVITDGVETLVSHTSLILQYGGRAARI